MDTVTVEIEGRAPRYPDPIRTILTYDPHRPYEVTAMLWDQPCREWAPWVFARDLLDPATSGTFPTGDVTVVWPGGGVVLVSLTSPGEGGGDDTITVTYPAVAVREFLLRSYRAVPRGRERMDIDAELRQIFH